MYTAICTPTIPTVHDLAVVQSCSCTVHAAVAGGVAGVGHGMLDLAVSGATDFPGSTRDMAVSRTDRSADDKGGEQVPGCWDPRHYFSYVEHTASALAFF